MGYRSDVVILVCGERVAVEAYKLLWLVKAATSIWDQGEVNIYGDNAEWIIRLDDVKWYPGEAAITAYTRIVDECPDMLCAELLRIGEEEDDIEHNTGGDGEPLLYVSRTIERY